MRKRPLRVAKARSPRKRPGPTPAPESVLPTTWRTLDRMTGAYKDILIVQMENSHLLAAIAYCERKAADYQHITGLSPVETAKSLWPGYLALVTEAARRFNAPSVPSIEPAGRIVILPEEQKED